LQPAWYPATRGITVQLFVCSPGRTLATKMPPPPLPGAGRHNTEEGIPDAGTGASSLPPSAFAADNYGSGAASAGAATITPATAGPGRRASMDNSPPRGVANSSWATLGGEASSSGGDIEAAGASLPPPGLRSSIGGLNDQLMEPVPLASRIKLEFADLSTWVPRLFGPGVPGGALTRSATLLKSASTRAFRGSTKNKGGRAGGVGAAAPAPGDGPKNGGGGQPMRQVRAGGEAGGVWPGERTRQKCHTTPHHENAAFSGDSRYSRWGRPPFLSLSLVHLGPVLHFRVLQPGRGPGPHGAVRVG
jgi:hypothetical protein